MEVIIRRSIEISCAHRLEFHHGKCHNEHGHNYKVEAFMRNNADLVSASKEGMVVDFALLDAAMNDTIGKWDHTNLNSRTGAGTYQSILGMTNIYQSDDNWWRETTCENLAIAWLHDLQQVMPRVCGLRVWESERSYAQVGVCG